jgi:hypothetical protein
MIEMPVSATSSEAPVAEPLTSFSRTFSLAAMTADSFHGLQQMLCMAKRTKIAILIDLLFYQGRKGICSVRSLVPLTTPRFGIGPSTPSNATETTCSSRQNELESQRSSK